MRFFQRNQSQICLLVLYMLSFAYADFNKDWSTETRKPGVQVMNINEANNPIKKVYWRNGQPKGGKPVKVVVAIEAEITQSRANDRINFGTAVMNDYKANYDRLPGDEAGHLVAAVIYGPPQWYNLVPQNKAVNRNAGGKFAVTDWFKTEKEMREFVDANKQKQGKVLWRVICFYASNNRPTKFGFQATFLLGGQRATKLPIEGTLDNTPPKSGQLGISG